VSEPNPPHRRRPRYRGTHPRRFEEKYKELAPERFPEFVARVRARGMTPAGQHVPIMVAEVLDALSPRPGERGVDGTLGFGGHARHLLERIAPDGTLLALDVDALELAKTEARLRAAGHGPEVLIVRRTNFAALERVLGELEWSDGLDFALFDLGLSSMQIDDPARGFSVKFDGPLDMRLHAGKNASAADWLFRATTADIARVLRDGADEPHAERIASALDRRRGALHTTQDLVRAVHEALGERVATEARDMSVRRVFQAIRIAVNDELGVLDQLLRQLPACLRPGGRVAFLTFHSGEDRRVKLALRAGFDTGRYAAVSATVIRASPAERRSNPRSAPAKLRWARRAPLGLSRAE
jgi:16S rRNA (cytosine1402-N4)-methyltransferase